MKEMEKIKMEILYLCNMKKPFCYGDCIDCKHTTDPAYAKNPLPKTEEELKERFRKIDNEWWEEDTE